MTLCDNKYKSQTSSHHFQFDLHVGITCGGEGGANAPPIFFIPKNSLVRQECVHLGMRVGERGCMYIKDLFK